jgi:hypothetical protein
MAQKSHKDVQEIHDRERKEEMIRALESTLGIVSAALKMVDMNKNMHYRWIKDDEEYAAKVKEIQNVTLDFVENQLLKQIREGNTQATIFYLRTKGKERGYIETPTIDVGTVNPIQIVLPQTLMNEPKTIDISHRQDKD